MDCVGKNIFIADDDPDDIFLFECAVRDVCPQHELTVASDGVMLLQLLSKCPIPDIILLDINMPLKTGKECLTEIRKKSQFINVMIIMLTTSSQKNDIEYCMLSGADHYLVKPTTYKGLKEIVTGICEGKYQ